MILGGGGYGLVVKNASGKASKLLKECVACDEARKEFSDHVRIYKIVSAFIKRRPEFRGKIGVPVPHTFRPYELNS